VLSESEDGRFARGDGLVTPQVYALGKYQLFATLGRGGMADVYLAVAVGPAGFNKLVVVKTLRSPDVDASARALEMFLNEARLSARLNHPNVVQTYEVGEEQGTYFIVMEYLEGQPLDRLLKRAQRAGVAVPMAWAARVVADGLQGLHYAHELRDYDGTPLNIIHRDVSPHNLFVAYDGGVKILDFGIAKAATAAGLTATGVLKGKVAYMAPEQANSAKLDRRADIFSMGILLWEAIAGRRLMAGDTPAATLANVLHHNVPPLSQVRPDVDPELEAITMRALAPAPSDRYPSARAMYDELDAYLRRAGDLMRPNEVGAFVVSLFASTRADMQQNIQAQMAALDSAAVATQLSALGGQVARSEGSNSGEMRRRSLSPAPFGELGFGPQALPRLHENAISSHSRLPAAAQNGTPYAGTTDLTVPETIRRPASRFFRRALVPGVLLGLGACAVTILGRSPANRPAALVVASALPADTAAAIYAAAPLGPAPAADPSGPTAPATPARSAAPADAPAPIDAPAGQARQAPGRPPRTSRAAEAPRGKPSSAPAEDASSAEAAASNGFLTLDTYPWTRVTIAGRAVGTTPVVRVPLPPGTHNVVLENPEKGLRQVTSVTIKSGETTSRRLAFE
jgi:eukaryotic-like serine/threonine-protein kinase